ncbi:energy-coupling factor ABC transporter ATP-binding protein [Allofustis seminis]|uniref:energy-coupling factor ABC transporter ATP-binding protein n=1 Tax=Allofustis seminis TaxID=166939 RepID=UPI00036C0C50|nr:ABC transporter ATP-binding protein [Allofustis seminis]
MGLIDLKNVTYTYPLADEPSIKDFTYSFEQGKFYAILGANESGKTTLCNIIRGFIPDFFQGELTGEVLFNQEPLSHYTLSELAPYMGYVFQNPFNQITGARDNVFEEIAYGLENLGVAKGDIEKQVKDIMEMTNIMSLADKNPFELSGGQQQRVAFASILALSPDIFIIDEPTSQLDPQESERIFDIIHQLKNAGKTIILVEHKIELISEYADEVLVLEEGRLICSGKKHDVLSDISLKERQIDLPETTLLADALRKAGYNIPEKLITKEEMKAALMAHIKGVSQ